MSWHFSSPIDNSLIQTRRDFPQNFRIQRKTFVKEKRQLFLPQDARHTPGLTDIFRVAILRLFSRRITNLHRNIDFSGLWGRFEFLIFAWKTNKNICIAILSRFPPTPHLRTLANLNPETFHL